MKVIIAGSRGCENYEHLKECMDYWKKVHPVPTYIISGTARGADRLGERWAEEHGVDLIRMPANWDKFGRSAGYKRNEAMAEIADGLVAIWDGKSRGTMHMIEIAKRKGLKVAVFKDRKMAMTV